MKKQSDFLLNHDYDGIQEFDNDLPGWWVNLFNITIVFAVIYIFYFHVFDIGLLQEAEYVREMQIATGGSYQGDVSSFGFSSPLAATNLEFSQAQKAAMNKYIGEDVTYAELLVEAKRKATPEELAALESGGLLTTPTASTPAVAVTTGGSGGQAVFMKNCAVCHGNKGEGLVGPNFTDDYWIHGNTDADMEKIINNGVIAKGMIPWRGVISNQDIADVIAYIHTLRGTNPPNPKAPEGDLYDY